jgi:hypothetical protein
MNPMKKRTAAAKPRSSPASGKAAPGRSLKRPATRRKSTASATGARSTRTRAAPARAPLESSVEQAARIVAERNRCLLVKLHHGIVGFPDRILLRPGSTCAFVEFKRPGERPTKIQAYWLGRLNYMGFRAVVVRNLRDFDGLLTMAT